MAQIWHPILSKFMVSRNFEGFRKKATKLPDSGQFAKYSSTGVLYISTYYYN